MFVFVFDVGGIFLYARISAFTFAWEIAQVLHMMSGYYPIKLDVELGSEREESFSLSLPMLLLQHIANSTSTTTTTPKNKNKNLLTYA